MKSEQDINNIIEKYADTVKRICVLHLKNNADTEDIFQKVFLKYILKSPCFENETHEKAWIIRVTLNECKDYFKSFFRKNKVTLDNTLPLTYEMPDDNLAYVREAVSKLPTNYRNVIYLHYFEQYTAVEISKILGKNVNTIYTLLARGKKILKESLGGETFE